MNFPSTLLMKAGKRPRRWKKVYTWVSLHKLLRHMKEVAKHNGKLVLAGAFAVVKN